MVANIMRNTNGKDAFASARIPAWHRLGTVTEGAMTAEEALELAQLDWEVLKSETPVKVDIPGHGLVPVPGKFATFRADNGAPFGVVGSQFTPVQNRDVFGLLNDVVDASGAHFETAGALGNGEKVFMSMKLPEGVKVQGTDEVEVFLLGWNGHDGSMALGLQVTPIRVVCQNTLSMAIRDKNARKITLRHTTNATKRIAEVREALGVVFTGLEEFEALAQQLSDQDMSADQFGQFVDTLVPVPAQADASKRSITLAENAQASLHGLWNAATQQSIAETKWAAWNAVVEHADWMGNVRGGDDKELVRATRQITGGTDPLKEKALDLLLAG